MTPERLAYLKKMIGPARTNWEKRTISGIQMPEEPAPRVEGENVVQLPRQPVPVFSLDEADVYLWDAKGEKCEGVFRLMFVECEGHIILAVANPDAYHSGWWFNEAFEMVGAPVREGTEWHLVRQEGVKPSDWKDKPDAGPVRRRNTRRYEDGWDLMAAAPQDGQIIMVAWVGEFEYTFAQYNTRKGKWVDIQTKKPFTLPPSHWRPLPQPPVRDPD